MQSCTSVDLACSTGVTLSVAQRAALQSSLPLLKKNYKFSEVFLFGKILCKAGDYLVAFGLEGCTTKKKWFYWCVPSQPAAHLCRTYHHRPLASSRAYLYPTRLRQTHHSLPPSWLTASALVCAQRRRRLVGPADRALRLGQGPDGQDASRCPVHRRRLA